MLVCVEWLPKQNYSPKSLAKISCHGTHAASELHVGEITLLDGVVGWVGNGMSCSAMVYLQLLARVS